MATEQLHNLIADADADNADANPSEMNKEELVRYLRFSEKRNSEKIRWMKVHQIVQQMLITVERRRTELATMKTQNFLGQTNYSLKWKKDALERIAHALEAALDVCSSSEEHYFARKLRVLDRFIHMNRHHIEVFDVLVQDIDDIISRVYPDEDVEDKLSRMKRRHRQAMSASTNTYSFIE